MRVRVNLELHGDPLAEPLISVAVPVEQRRDEKGRDLGARSVDEPDVPIE